MEEERSIYDQEWAQRGKLKKKKVGGLFATTRNNKIPWRKKVGFAQGG